ncbi:MAG: OmpA family protein [Gammaproteobacteria bacterium]|nr:OmpA family protein [Gammaproteobacteria bacterium]MBU1654054.1 OmpA family protein [Gammaproteobacteria bacterium]MBU1961736.1 OmpA family protein [Gammaproteobacteria bacterium]
MSGHLKAFLLILVLGALGILGTRFALPLLKDQLQKTTSDAASVKGTLKIGVDNWIGYFPLCSPEMARRMRQAGYALSCQDDNADYKERFKRLKQGELQFAVATVDSYLLNGAAQDYPGAIVAVIDESKGGDAIVARRDAIPNLNALKDRRDLRIAYTPQSPSEHLLKSLSEHFDLGLFRDKQGAWAVKTDGSNAALAQLLAGKADAAVLWEPDVSRALAEPAFGKLIGTEDTDKLIVDVLLVERRFSRENPALVSLLFKEYFETLRWYHEHPNELRADVKARTGLGGTQVEAMLRGVGWATLNENGAGWFGVAPGGFHGEEGLIAAIDSALAILQANGDFNRNPLPDGDPYRLTNRQFIAGLYQGQSGGPGQTANGDPLARPFPPLDGQGWRRLKEIGTLRIEPISFRLGSAMLDYEGKQILDGMSEKLRHYPNFRILVKGHTGLLGDPQANLELSAERAAAVARYLGVTYGMDANRIRAIGHGASRPLPRKEGESDRAYGYRLPRVEISLATEAY